MIRSLLYLIGSLYRPSINPLQRPSAHGDRKNKEKITTFKNKNIKICSSLLLKSLTENVICSGLWSGWPAAASASLDFPQSVSLFQDAQSELWCSNRLKDGMISHSFSESLHTPNSFCVHLKPLPFLDIIPTFLFARNLFNEDCYYSSTLK